MKKRVFACLLAVLLCVGVGTGPLAVTTAAINSTTEYNYIGLFKIKIGEKINLREQLVYFDKDGERYLQGRINWSAVMPDIVSVNEKGIATGLRHGSTTVIARGTNNVGDTIEHTMVVRVEKDTAPIKVKKTTYDASITLFVNQTVNLSQLAPASKATWSLDNEKYATVKKDGTVMADAIGKTIVTAAYKDADGAAQTFTVELTVRGDNEYNSERKDSITLRKGESLDLLAMFYPNLTTVSRTYLDELLLVSTSDRKVAAVEGYTVTAKAAGRCKVTLRYDEFTRNGYRGSEILQIRVVD